MEQKLILCIDDDADDRMLLIDIIANNEKNVQVAEAENGSIGLQYLNEAKNNHLLPCLIILDINMPVMDGRKTLEMIRQDPQLQHIPVVVYTSSQSPNDYKFFKSHGVEFITKPMTLSSWKKAVDEMLYLC
ncbi:MAG TPA: response regulator [Flavitalea sp.]|nr:response regulator [Flavitalea sp.]